MRKLNPGVPSSTTGHSGTSRFKAARINKPRRKQREGWFGPRKFLLGIPQSKNSLRNVYTIPVVPAKDKAALALAKVTRGSQLQTLSDFAARQICNCLCVPAIAEEVDRFVSTQCSIRSLTECAKGGVEKLWERIKTWAFKTNPQKKVLDGESKRGTTNCSTNNKSLSGCGLFSDRGQQVNVASSISVDFCPEQE